MDQLELIIQRIEHTMDQEDESHSVEALRSCLCEIYEIASGRKYLSRSDRDRNWKGLNF